MTHTVSFYFLLYIIIFFFSLNVNWLMTP